jgi:hypothetical protein
MGSPSALRWIIHISVMKRGECAGAAPFCEPAAMRRMESGGTVVARGRF